MKFHSTVIFVNNIEISKKFYTQYLNLTVEHDFGNNVITNEGISIWQISKEHLINKKLQTKILSNRFELYFECKNIDTIFNALQNAGITFLHQIKEEAWGQRTIRFFDPDNHLIEIGETLEVFVSNMNKNGLTVDQISSKSGIQIETIKKLLNIE